MRIRLMLPLALRLLLLSACCLLCLAVFPQTGNIYETRGYDNGRIWTGNNDVGKIQWVSGYIDGVNAGLGWSNVDVKTSTDVRKSLIPGLTVGEVVKSLDQFYATPENGPIPISIALTVVAAKAGGATEQFLQNMTEEYRKISQESK